MSATNALAYSTAILIMAKRTFITRAPVVRGPNYKTFFGHELILPCNKLERLALSKSQARVEPTRVEPRKYETRVEVITIAYFSMIQN